MTQVNCTHAVHATHEKSPRFALRLSQWTTTVGWLALALNLTSCTKPLTPSDCEKLLLKYVDHLAASDRPDSTALERVRFKQQAREKAARDPEFRQCSKTVSHAQFECAMNASNTDEFERCLL